MRIVSLLGSGTDLVIALGAGAELVGRSHECDAPEVAHLPELSRPTFPTTGSSAEIDRLVRQKLRAGEPLYAVDEAALAALAPDVVITQTHCEVCAVGAGAVCASPGGRLSRERVVAFRGGTLAGVLEDFRAVAQVIGRAEAGQRLDRTLRAERDAWLPRLAGRARPRVLCLEWIEPAFSMGNWGPELVALAGGEALLAEAGAPSRAVPWERIVSADPDVLVVAPCAFRLSRARDEMPVLAAQPGFSALRAVRAGRVFVADGNRYFNRSSPGLFGTVQLLAELLHPDHGAAAPSRLAGRSYERWPSASMI